MLNSHLNTFIEIYIMSCFLKLLHFALFWRCLATTHAPNQEINMNNAAAFVEPWCHQLASETTVNAVQATILHHLITLPPSKNVSKLIFLRSCTLLVSYSNYHSIDSSLDKCTKFQAYIGNICVPMWHNNKTEYNNTFEK